MLKAYYYCKYRILMLIILMLKCARCEVYRVGDDEGWTSDSNYDSWSQKYNFTVGDVLVFNYMKGQHNVYEVMEGTYRTCDASNGVIAKYESGEDEVRLSQQRKYWFICNVNGHCLGGMRLSIDVKPSTSNTSTNNPPPIGQSSPPNSSSCNPNLDRRGFLFYLVVFGILIKFIV